MRIPGLKTKAKILIGICSPLVLLLILGGVSIYSINSIVSTSKWVDHTHEVLTKAAIIVTAAVDMETGMRGYLLAGEEDFLAPYERGSARFHELITGLRKAVDDNPAQVQLLAEAEQTIRDWLENVTEATIALRREIGDAETMNDMADLVGKARGKIYFDKFREQIATFIGREAALLEERRAEFKTAGTALREDIGLAKVTTGWVDHTHEVLASAAGLVAAAVDMETGMRGYLLTGEDDFLAPYQDGKTSFLVEILALQKSVDDNPAQVARLERVKGAMQQWIDQVTEPAIALRGQVNAGRRPLHEIDAVVSRRAGKKLFDSFREQIAAFAQIEADLIAERKATADAMAARIEDNLGTIDTNEEWVTHTYEVIEHANSILAAAVDMETGMRGYLLAGRDEFLTPYERGSASFYELIAGLRKTVDDNPAQVQLLKETEQTIREWQENVTEPTISLRREIGDAMTMDDMADLVGEASGKFYFDRFRALMAEFRAKEEGLMNARRAANDSTISTTLIIIVACAVLAFGIGLLLAWLIGNGIANPLNAMTGAMLQLADGNKSVDIPGTDRSDEIGVMAGAVQVFKENAIENEHFEEQLRQSKLEALGRLAGGIAHDFNNLLLPIITIAEVTRDDFPPDGRQWANLDTVVKAGQRGRALVNQILKFSRRQPMHRQPIGLAEVVEEALELSRALIPPMIQIRADLDDDVGTVLADSNQIHVVLMNLVSNAGQAIGLDKGVIDVGLRKASIDGAGGGPTLLQAGTYARLTVSDSGAGMDDKTLANIFDPFFTTKPAGEGTGMGLAAVHGIVARHDGAIMVSSKPGEETTFAVYIPILD